MKISNYISCSYHLFIKTVIRHLQNALNFFHNHIWVIIVWICDETKIVNQLFNQSLANHWMFSLFAFAWFVRAACVMFLLGSITAAAHYFSQWSLLGRLLACLHCMCFICAKQFSFPCSGNIVQHNLVLLNKSIGNVWRNARFLNKVVNPICN